MKRAFKIYQTNPTKWKEMIQRGMQMNYGWEESAEKYLSLYQKPSSFHRIEVQENTRRAR